MNSNWTKIGIGILILLVIGVLIYYFVIRRKRRREFKEEINGILPGGGSGTKNFPKELPPLTEIPKKITPLYNRRTKARKLLKKKSGENDFEFTNISVGPGKLYGIFDPQKEVADKPVVVEWKTDTGTYEMLRVERDGKYYYIARKNATDKGDESPQITEQKNGNKNGNNETARLIARTLNKLLEGITLWYEVKQINDTISLLSDDMLKKVSEEYKKLYGKSLLERLKEEIFGERDYKQAIERLKNLE